MGLPLGPAALLMSGIAQFSSNDYYQIYKEIRELNPTVADVSLTQSGAFQPRTPFFAAPEQLNNQKRLIDPNNTGIPRTIRIGLRVIL